ncbi:MAG: polyBeta-D-mannuronate lyase [Podoviridae sp. ctdc61]|nr:MAG: polyBeta-D-mannuronate lyase [Podoviridae sp. ctdc61]
MNYYKKRWFGWLGNDVIDDGGVIIPPDPVDPTDPVDPPPVNVKAVVTIQGTLELGGTLTSTITDPNGVSSEVTYQWFDGTNIIGFTDTYVVKEVDLGKSVSLTVTFTDNDGFDEVSKSNTLILPEPDIDVPVEAPNLWEFEPSVGFGDYFYGIGNFDKVSAFYREGGKPSIGVTAKRTTPNASFGIATRRATEPLFKDKNYRLSFIVTATNLSTISLAASPTIGDHISSPLNHSQPYSK